MDGDLRKPAQFKLFDKREETGPSFSDVLEGSTALEKLPRSEQNFRGLGALSVQACVSSGGASLQSAASPNPGGNCGGRMDVIVVDCPPIVAAADAEIWMHQADTVALVVRQDYSDIRVINDTVDLIWKKRRGTSRGSS